MRSQGLGLGLAVLSAATFGTSGSFASSLMSSGWSPAAAVTVRVAVAAVILTIPALVQMRGRWGLVRRSLPALFAFGIVAVGGCQLCFFNAVEHLSVSVALLLEYSGTLLVVLWLWVRHGKRPRPLTAVGGGVALGGLVLVLDLTGAQRVDVVGVIWGLAAATGLAVYFVISSRTDELLPPIAMAWGAMVIGAATLGLFALTGLVHFHARTAAVSFAGHHASWLVPVVGLSVVAGAFAYATGIGAARLLGATLSSFFGLTEVLFATLFAWLLLDQRPTVLQGIGGVIVLVGIVLVRADDRAGRAGATDVDALGREPTGAGLR
jgi:drug/metabolite transporter (DMT)-like permease